MILTVGHSNRTWDAFVEILNSHQVQRIFDVRAYPRSKHNPQFSAPGFERQLAELGVGYSWEGKALGGFREPLPGSENVSLSVTALRGYADHMPDAEFVKAVDRIVAASSGGRAAMMCAEADPNHCHRNLVADYLTAVLGEQVWHLTSPIATHAHQCSQAARLVEGRLVYDRHSQGELGL